MQEAAPGHSERYSVSQATIPAERSGHHHRQLKACKTAAESTEEALSLLKDSFDAVISDISMPGHDGHTFCRRLRSSDATKNLVLIASSGNVFPDDQRLALASGFDDFVPKPVMEEELFEVLRKHLRVKWVYAERNKCTERN